ncbi:DUF423 domain-containing protein [Phreatobacter oligotrophus]|uniref:Uncharacterized membrane protein YgdD (TMEM256/DUF423 family) n=1 Tax=Phreatobacter oligotrophus TaxID=1122261 RepID=A0A2T4YXL2_9HYPH|nr:DUF423 domain-containing protein [Phreatobacter oligotrophus]PTM51086.1 uncharacterized membrane protein YgdD (TMEM256/DUF423 family) [Phreatobacter oligotrophus]
MTATRLLVLCAGLMGAAGVALAAMASHAYAGTSLQVAASMLSLQAPAVLAIALGRKAGLLHDAVARIAAWALVAGTAVFAGDLAMRTFTGQALFPMAAPVGGMAMIAAWLGAAVAGALGGRQSG